MEKKKSLTKKLKVSDLTFISMKEEDVILEDVIKKILKGFECSLKIENKDCTSSCIKRLDYKNKHK